MYRLSLSRLLFILMVVLFAALPTIAQAFESSKSQVRSPQAKATLRGEPITPIPWLTPTSQSGKRNTASPSPFPTMTPWETPTPPNSLTRTPTPGKPPTRTPWVTRTPFPTMTPWETPTLNPLTQTATQGPPPTITPWIEGTVTTGKPLMTTNP